MKLAPRYLAVDEERGLARAQRSDLARDQSLRVQQVRVGRHVDDLAEPGVRDRAVVALEKVLARDLPVPLQLELGAKAELQCVEVEDLGQSGRNVAERRRQRFGVRIRVDEDKRPPGVDADLDEVELVGVEARLPVRARRRTQATVETVRPGVVRALERLALSGSVRHDVPAVTADVEEGAELPVTRAGDDDRDLAGRRGEESTVCDLSGVPHVLPRAREDPLSLEPEHLGVRVPGPWQGPLHAGTVVSWPWREHTFP
jgi:hypothetical protein